ncbi:hypothetical protein [Serratia fonticola]
MRYATLFIIPLLSACSFSFIKFDDIPVVKAAYDSNITRQSLISIGGKPDSEVTLPGGKGTCLNYHLKKDGAQSPFYIVFDNNGKRKQFGYINCAEAMSRDLLV